MGNVVLNVTADGFGAACTDNRKLYSAFAYILPYMEQGAGYNAYNFQWPCLIYPNATHGANVTAGTQLVSSYLCPSDQSRRRLTPPSIHTP